MFKNSVVFIDKSLKCNSYPEFDRVLFLILYFENEKMHMNFLICSGNSHSFYCLCFNGTPWLLTLLESLALGTEKQCTVVKSNYHSSFTLSRLFAQSPNSSVAKELSRGCKKAIANVEPTKSLLFALKYTYGRFFILLFFLVQVPSLQSGQGSTPLYLTTRPIARMIDHFITFLRYIHQVQ